MHPLMRSVEEDAADLSIIDALLAIQNQRRKLLGIYDLVDGDVEDPQRQAGRMLVSALAQITADRPVLKPDAAIPLNPIM